MRLRRWSCGGMVTMRQGGRGRQAGQICSTIQSKSNDGTRNGGNSRHTRQSPSYEAVRCRRGGSAGGGPRPSTGAAGEGGEAGVGVSKAGESERPVPFLSGCDWSDVSSSLASWPGDAGALAGGVSEARFAWSFDTMDCKAADADDLEGDSRPSVAGRDISGLACITWVELARGGSGGGTRGGCGVGCTLGSAWLSGEATES